MGLGDQEQRKKIYNRVELDLNTQGEELLVRSNWRKITRMFRELEYWIQQIIEGEVEIKTGSTAGENLVTTGDYVSSASTGAGEDGKVSYKLGTNWTRAQIDQIDQQTRRSYVRDWYAPATGAFAGNTSYNSQSRALGPFPTALDREVMGVFELPQSVFLNATSHTVTIRFLWWTDGVSTNDVDFQFRLFPIKDADVFPLSFKTNSLFSRTPAAATIDLVQEDSLTTGALNWTTADTFFGFRLNRRGDTDANPDNVYVQFGIEMKWNGDLSA